jgi:hypothetical protein
MPPVLYTNTSAAALIAAPKALYYGRIEHVAFSGSKGLNIIFAGYVAEDVLDMSSLIGLNTIYIHDPETGRYRN